MTTTDDGVSLSLMDPAVQRCPWPFYEQLHAHCPVYRMPETGFVLVTRYEDVKAVLADTETFSNRAHTVKGVQTDERARLRHTMLAERGWVRADTLHSTDPPVHTRYRRLLNRVFSPRRVRELTPTIEAITHRLIDAFVDRGECDFFAEFAFPLPGTIIAGQIGLDASDIDRFKAWGDAMLAPTARMLTDDELVANVELELEAQHHFARVFEERRHEPRDDIMSALVHAHTEDGADDEPFTMEELQGLMLQFVTGGFETVTTGLTHALRLLLEHPDQLALLRADRSLMKGFVEEALRTESPVQGQARKTTRDTEIGGVPIPAGTTVIARFGAANRDAAEFDEPARFDIRRANAVNHLAFGGGVHYCIGAPLARAELTTAFTALLDRTDDWAPARPLEHLAELPTLWYLPMRELPFRFRKVT